MIYRTSFDVEYLMFVSRAAFRETFNPASFFLLNVDQAILTVFFLGSAPATITYLCWKIFKSKENYKRRVNFNAGVVIQSDLRADLWFGKFRIANDTTYKLFATAMGFLGLS